MPIMATIMIAIPRNILIFLYLPCAVEADRKPEAISIIEFAIKLLIKKIEYILAKI